MKSLLYLLLAMGLGGILSASPFTTIEGVVLIPTPWGDGDSFQVRFPDGEKHTLRLYGADCIESDANTESDARRIRAQRRYFGISNYGGSPRASIELALALGEAATVQVREWLSEPFTVHTTFADARGSPRYKRIYAFVTTPEGEDLATLLVRKGLARAHGVVRSTPDGQSHEEYREQLRDAELIAARQGLGAWAYTDWDSLSDERRTQRRDDQEDRIAMGTARPSGELNPNTASKSELTQLPGIGEVTAQAIIDNRPYKEYRDLLRVRGIGPATLEQIQPWLTLAD